MYGANGSFMKLRLLLSSFSFYVNAYPPTRFSGEATLDGISRYGCARGENSRSANTFALLEWYPRVKTEAESSRGRRERSSSEPRPFDTAVNLQLYYYNILLMINYYYYYDDCQRGNWRRILQRNEREGRKREKNRWESKASVQSSLESSKP